MVPKYSVLARFKFTFMNLSFLAAELIFYQYQYINQKMNQFLVFFTVNELFSEI